jgi:hypothetical protein
MKTLLLALALSTGLPAATVMYQVTVDTSSQLGNTGNLYLAVASGNNTADPLQIIVQNALGAVFSGTAPLTTGNTSGTLPTSVLFNHVASVNDDYLHIINAFGSQLTFLVTLTGPAVLEGTAPAGTTLSIGFDDGTNSLFTSDPSGLVATFDIGPLGAVVATSLAAGTTLDAVPEPGTWVLMSAGVLLVAFARKRR